MVLRENSSQYKCMIDVVFYYHASHNVLSNEWYKKQEIRLVMIFHFDTCW